MLMEDMVLSKIIMTSGVFDLLHMGHINIFLKAKKYGDYLIVAVSTDELVKSYKKIKPVVCFQDRINLIRQLKCVDKVIKQTKLVDIRQFKKYQADLFALGDDWKNNFSNDGINWLRKHKKIIWIPYTQRLSTTKIKRQIIKNGYNILQAQLQRT